MFKNINMNSGFMDSQNEYFSKENGISLDLMGYPGVSKEDSLGYLGLSKDKIVGSLLLVWGVVDTSENSETMKIMGLGVLQ